MIFWIVMWDLFCCFNFEQIHGNDIIHERIYVIHINRPRHVVLAICTRIQRLFCRALINGRGRLRLHATRCFVFAEIIQQWVWTSLTKHGFARRCSSKWLQGLFFCVQLMGMCAPKQCQKLLKAWHQNSNQESKAFLKIPQTNEAFIPFHARLHILYTVFYT